MAENLSLFENVGKKEEPRKETAPLADRLRPHRWDEIRLPESIDDALLEQLKEGAGTPPSIIIWGPPGSGKTTLARLIGGSFQCNFVQLSAVLDGVKDVRDVVASARRSPLPTLLFVDEIHRFNKAQQDAFLPHIENGTLSLIGATTENPSFYLTRALLSRCRVLVLPPLSPAALENVARQGAEVTGLTLEGDALQVLVDYAGGDARRLLNALESYARTVKDRGRAVVAEDVQRYLKKSGLLQYDRNEEHYDCVSAMIKSLRGSDPDAALYWCFKMIESGDDPLFILRRLMIFASEDIGNADPRALQLAVATIQAFDRIGLPEGKIPIAQCVTYLATAPKSNRSYLALHSALAAVSTTPRAQVPLHLRNSPTPLMKELGYSLGYQYPHDLPNAFAPDVQYLPDEVKGQKFYEPSDRGYEKMISERMRMLRSSTEDPS